MLIEKKKLATDMISSIVNSQLFISKPMKKATSSVFNESPETFIDEMLRAVKYYCPIIAL
ncbi:hypothetical protein CLV93_105102 [Prolixibacter denitrificans]|uniref:Uncharacterized protein n=1 Tax=Prolixibacter denitrificans TaxID=1541063 RepID=A0A2P8CCL8_9BACT|nr:hypothetical protein CLV93_105102 [Prolixibacter denitrificans]GET21468.1 hypothetical protein JCM18694_17140 [Prolixibacter denitrificans]